MDWAGIKAKLNQVAEEARESGEYLDEHAVALCNFIPADPNKAADAEWLKERGWECFLETWSLPGTELNWYRGYLRCGKAQLDLDPSRMTVALFEAAAMEAMKHGE